MFQTLFRSSCIAATLAVTFTTGCSSLSCGEGTEQQDGSCVVSDGEGGADNGPAFEFAGAQAAGPASSTSILVAWLPASDSDAVYNVYVSTSAKDFNFEAPQATAPAGATTAIIPGLAENTKYFVVVRAALEGDELPSDTPVEVTTADDDTAPDFAGIAAAEPAEGAAVKVSWAAATDDLSPAGALVYFVYAAETADDLDLDLPVGVSDPGATSLEVVMPAPETNYVFVVRARDAASNFDQNDKTKKAESGKDVQAPVFSGCKAATPKSASTLAVTWSPATDDVALPEDISYNLYASETEGGFNFASPDATIKGELTGIIPGLDRSKTYYVTCRAIDPSDNEDKNTRVQVAKTKSDDQPPVFDGIITLGEVTPISIELSWDLATDNQSKEDDIVYDVFLSETSEEFDLEGEPWQTSEAGVDSLVVEGLDSHTTYYLLVLARDEGENRSEPGDELAASTKVSFQIDVLDVIKRMDCAASGCHSGLTPTGGMNLSPSTAYANLYDVDAETALGVGFKRAAPGDPANSHLIHRIKDTGPVEGVAGARMPLDGTIMSDDDIATIESWILEGAENN